MKQNRDKEREYLLKKAEKEERKMKKCQCKELKFTNPYSDSYECKKCGRLFVVTYKYKLIREVRPNERCILV